MSSDYEKKVFTIPNILSIIRIFLIPAFVIIYFRDINWLAGVVLIVSGITDIVDGYIARKYNMVSALGKALDPIADKLTQLTMFACLAIKYIYMLIPFVLMAVKELFAGILSLLVVRKTGTTYSSEWYGKVATVIMYVVGFVHIIINNIDKTASTIMIIVCTAFILLACILYAIRNIKVLRQK